MSIDRPPLRVVIADDDELTRGGIRLILGGIPGVEVIAEATNGVQARDLEQGGVRRIGGRWRVRPGARRRHETESTMQEAGLSLRG